MYDCPLWRPSFSRVMSTTAQTSPWRQFYILEEKNITLPAFWIVIFHSMWRTINVTTRTICDADYQLPNCPIAQVAMSSVKKDLISQKGSLVSLYVKPRKRWEKSNKDKDKDKDKDNKAKVLMSLDSLSMPNQRKGDKMESG